MRSFIITFVLVLSTSLLLAQSNDIHKNSDSTFIFGALEPKPLQPTDLGPLNNTWGIDLMMSTNGVGIGTFYRHEYADDLAGFIDFSISEPHDDQEVEYYDPYTGQSFVPGKVNRFLLMPLFVGIQKRLFKEDIVDNFRPYIMGAAGPTMLYVFPYNEEYFSGLGKGHPKYTFGGYFGFGAYFGSERSSLFGLNFRYYYVPYPGGIESLRRGSELISKDQFGGFYISLSWGGSW